MSSETSPPPAETESAPAPDLASRITPKETEAPEAELETDMAQASLDGGHIAGLGGSALEEPEFDVELKLSDLQADPNNPLYSVKAFEELNLSPEILKGISQLNFRKPSKIQERALPLLLRDPPTNLIGQSQSGTGKTAAFTLNMLSRVDLNLKRPQALVLAPSRELARQIMGVVQAMGQFVTGLRVVSAVPDPTRKGPLEGHIVVGTPGTVMDLIRRRMLDPQGLKVLVLDEADNMLDQQGMGDQCKRVKSLLPRDIQVVLFSATFPEAVEKYALHFAPNANELRLKHDELTVEGIKQFFFDCDGEEHKYQTLVRFYGLMTIASSIIFVKRRDTAAEIERRMIGDGHKVAQLTGALEGADRDKVIDSFRTGEAKVLITTNVLSRGIDVQSVSIVINYDIPELERPRGAPDPETYLHRIGRTGRFGRVGVAINFLSDAASFSRLQSITSYFKAEITPLPTDDWDEVEEQVKKVIKSSRAGRTTQEMNMDGSAE
ncbi:DEAD-domain-containing protein [Aulographum hederae CBS 113979]|uniref:RNA helicase n=1 Tax=Aulographum hederae CBS 113979 TaxID=1176131 RepID=A0A6G1GWL3_9PEZI|nr:DEAD-domain-containing protein [Aulographum hederae CBS 113979]